MPVQPNGALEVPKGETVLVVADPATTRMQTHQSSIGTLFTRMPCPDDVVQGEIGDCYLLASINAILRMPEGPDLIQSIMKDNGNGTITVRFYKAGRFQYISIGKSIVKEYKAKTLGIRHGTGKVLHSQGALWVSLLEKAYAAFMRTASQGPNPSYKDLEKGSGEEAMQAIVGGTGVSAAASVSEIDELRQIYLCLTEELSSGNKMMRIPKLKSDTVARITGSVFEGVDNANQHADNWFNWNTAEKRGALIEAARNPLSVEKFRELITKIGDGLDPVTRKLAVIWVEAHGAEMWSGEVGSAQYTPDQINQFMKIQRLLATQRAVTTGTPSTLKGQVTGVGHSGGEAKVSGLAAEHEYSIMDTKIDSVGRRYLLLRNPWGVYGRTYQTQTRSKNQTGPALLTPVASEDQGEFWIELTDFTRNFRGHKASPQVHTPQRQAFTNELQSKLADIQKKNPALK